MLIALYFSNRGVPATGLNPTPTLTVRNSATGAVVINAQPMSEIGSGWYRYDFAVADPTLDYVGLADAGAGAGLLDSERYIPWASNTEGSVTAILAKTGSLPASPASTGDIAAAVAPLALEANIQSHAAAALTAYDPATSAQIAALPQDKDGYTLSPTGIDSILDEVVEGAYTMRQLLRLMASTLFGKSSGGGTLSIEFRDLADSKSRITATVDVNGNRTAIALDAS